MNKLSVICSIMICLSFPSLAQTQYSEHAKLSSVRNGMVDKHATDETAALFYNLKEISGKKVLFGQQDAAASGNGWCDNSPLSRICKSA